MASQLCGGNLSRTVEEEEGEEQEEEGKTLRQYNENALQSAGNSTVWPKETQ